LGDDGKNHIHFLITGGTIDHIEKSTNTTAEQSAVLAYLHDHIRPHFEISQETLFLKDSRDITQEDRELILERIIAAPSPHLVLTHGTFTMVETSKFLHQHQSQFSEKIVVLIGSFIPINELNSDAPFAIGFGCASALTAPPGVFISMHGHLWSPFQVEKNLKTQRFEPIEF
jgi:L-asparaginase